MPVEVVCVRLYERVLSLASGEAASRALLQNTVCHRQTLSVGECVHLRVCVCVLVRVCFFDACACVSCVQLPELPPIHPLTVWPIPRSVSCAEISHTEC